MVGMDLYMVFDEVSMQRYFAWKTSATLVTYVAVLCVTLHMVVVVRTVCESSVADITVEILRWNVEWFCIFFGVAVLYSCIYSFFNGF